MNARKALAQKLRAALPARRIGKQPGFKVYPGPEEPDALDAGIFGVMVIRTDLEHAPSAPAGAYLSSFEIWILSPAQIAAEDDLDDALDQVILALDAWEFIAWQKAQRSTYRETPAYRVDAVAITQKTE